MSIEKISPKKVKEMLDNNTAVLIDVRSQREYENGHIDNSILIPLREIHDNENLPQEKDTNIIVYCAKGVRSQSFASILYTMGYKNLYNLGAITNWTYGLVKGV